MQEQFRHLEYFIIYLIRLCGTRGKTSEEQSIISNGIEKCGPTWSAEAMSVLENGDLVNMEGKGKFS